MGNFVNTGKNFPDAQKLSGWQCQRANGFFGTAVQRTVMQYRTTRNVEFALAVKLIPSRLRAQGCTMHSYTIQNYT